MPEMYPIGNTGIQPDALGSISKMIAAKSGMIGLQQQQQNLETGQFKQQSAQAEAQTAGLGAQQQQGVQDFFKSWDPTQHIADDGTTDLDSALQSPQFKTAGNAKPAIMQALLDVKNKQLVGKTALAGLNANLTTQFGTAVGALAKDPDVVADKADPTTGVNAGRAKIDNFIQNFSKLSPDAARVASIYGPITQHAPPGKLANGVAAMQMVAQSASEQQSQQNPTTGMIDTGRGQFPTVTPKATGVPQLTGQEFPVMPRPTVVTNPTTGGPAFTGGSYGSETMPINGQGMQPTVDLPIVKANVEQARKSGDAVGNNRKINQTILNLLPQTTTGKGTDFFHQVAATAGTNTGSSYQELAAFLDRQAASAASSMGLPNTNAGLETAQNLTGNTQLANKTIEDKTKYADALNTAAGAYRAGLERSLGTGGNPTAPPNYGAEPAYRAKWAANFDPDIFAYENAYKRGDTKEIQKIEAANGTKGMAALLQKRKTLMGLVNGQ